MCVCDVEIAFFFKCILWIKVLDYFLQYLQMLEFLNHNVSSKKYITIEALQMVYLLDVRQQNILNHGIIFLFVMLMQLSFLVHF